MEGESSEESRGESLGVHLQMNDGEKEKEARRVAG